MESNLKELEIEVSGRVQGIRFRKLVFDFCKVNGIRGYVRNREDGSVFIIAQGNEGKLKEFLRWIQTNPGISKIHSLNYIWKEISGNHQGFKIVKDRAFLVDKTMSLINLGKSLVVKEERKIPVHVAVIPDGNRRWAKEKGLHGSYGHYKAGSYQNIKSLIMEAEKLGVKYLSFWGFSTENWKRDSKEINAIFSLVIDDIKKFRVDSEKNKIKFKHIGRKDRLPKKLLDELKKLEEETKNNEGIRVQLCLDYGGRDELIRAISKMVKSGVKDIDEKSIMAHLDSYGIPDPDLIIRTSGEKRTSGFMPFQSVYSELYFTPLYFPEFGPSELRKAVEEYGNRKRRFGGS